MDKEIKSIVDLSSGLLSNLVNVEYYELQYWTYGAVHIEKFVNKDNALQRLNYLVKYYEKQFKTELQYMLVYCEYVTTNTDIDWYNELLEKGEYGCAF